MAITLARLKAVVVLVRRCVTLQVLLTRLSTGVDQLLDLPVAVHSLHVPLMDWLQGLKTVLPSFDLDAICLRLSFVILIPALEHPTALDLHDLLGLFPLENA